MDFLRSLLSSVITEITTDWARRKHEDHANRHKPGDPPPTVVHAGWLTQLAGPLVTAPVAAIAALAWSSILLGNQMENAWFAALFFSAIAIWLGLGSYDAFVRRIEWTETEVRFRKWNSDRTSAWKDIVGLTEKSHPPHIRIIFRDGISFGVSETMNGSRYFLRIVERRLTPDNTGGGKRRRRRRRRKESPR
jgi:hypothetical protein